MNRRVSRAHEPPAVSADAVRAALARILASSALAGANRSATLLKYLVEETLAGRSRYLKEYALGVEALGRGRDFDPRADPIARVEASRLRKRLALYHATEGADDQIVIRLPKGAYVPQFEARQGSTRAAATPTLRRGRIASTLASTAFLVAIGFALGAWFGMRERVTSTLPPLRLDLDLGAPGVLASEVGSDLAVSPDGRMLVFVTLLPDGSTRLYARRLDELAAYELPGTIGARGPFLSPDGAWVGFWAQGKLKKTLVAGGASPVTLADATDLLGASWNERGEIVAALSQMPTLWRIPDSGGVPSPLFRIDAPGPHPRWPQWLPGDRHVLMTTFSRSDESSIEVASLDDGSRKLVIRGATFGRYLPSGHLIYVDRGTLFAARFDIERLELTGNPYAILNGVAYSTVFGFAHLDVAPNGTLVYRRSDRGELKRLAWLDAAGATPLPLEPGQYQWPRLAPGERAIAFSLREGSDADIWIYDTTTRHRTRLTSTGGDEGAPIFTPDGAGIVYNDGSGALVWQRHGGSSAAATLLPGVAIPWSFAPDGSTLAYHRLSEATGFDLWTVATAVGSNGASAGEPRLFYASDVFETYPTFSPDGQWIAYGSNESGVWEVYVRAYPDDGRAVRISSNGGRIPAWSRARPELVYETNDHRLMVVDYEIRDGAFLPGDARAWSNVRLADTGVIANFDLADDGERAIVLLPFDTEQHRNHVTLVSNALELPERTPSSRP